MYEQESLKEFREFLNKYKKKILAKTDDPKSPQQDTEYLKKEVLQSIDALYYRVKDLIDNIPPQISANRPFEYLLFTEGGLDYLRTNSDAKELFLHTLAEDLRRFPFTTSPDLIDVHSKDPTIQPPNIVSNEE